MSNTQRRWLTPREVAAYYNISLAQLRHWRRSGKGPKWRRLSYRVIRYDAWTLDS